MARLFSGNLPLSRISRLRLLANRVAAGVLGAVEGLVSDSGQNSAGLAVFRVGRDAQSAGGAGRRRRARRSVPRRGARSPGELDGLYSSPPKRGASQNQILLFEREEVPEARSPQDYQVRPFVREVTTSLSMLVITVSNDSKASGGYTQRC